MKGFDAQKMGQQHGTEQFRERLHIIVQYPPLKLFCASRKIGLNHLFHCSIACRVSRICPQKPRRKFLETVDSFNPNLLAKSLPRRTPGNSAIDKLRPIPVANHRPAEHAYDAATGKKIRPPPEKSKSATT
jgi:hypothetical protein